MSKLTIRLVDREGPYQAMFLKDGDLAGLMEFYSLEDFLQYLSMQPRNRVRIENPELLQTFGAPIILRKNGTVSRTDTVRSLYRRMNPRQIAQSTGLPEETVSEIVARIK